MHPRNKPRDLQMDVLDEICQARITTSAVTLTADLVNRRRISEYGDPLGLVIWTLETLNEKGMVTYHYGRGNEVPVDIRATDAGYQYAGYELAYRIVESGRRQRHATSDLRTGDTTDYRNQPLTAIGYEIERMTLRHHIDKYPDHPHHRRQLEECTMPAKSLAPHLERKAQLLVRSMPDAPLRDIQAVLNDHGIKMGLEGVRERRLEINGERIPEYRRKAMEQRSLKMMLLDIIEREGLIADDHDLPRLVRMEGRAEDLHNILHALNSLAKSGVVTFQRRHVGKQQRYYNIRSVNVTNPTSVANETRVTNAPTHARIGIDRPNGGTVAPGGPVIRVPGPAPMPVTIARSVPPTDAPRRPEPAEVAPEPTLAATEAPSAPTDGTERYPVLAELRRFAKSSAEVQTRANALRAAASMVEEYDQSAANDLMRRAEQISDSARMLTRAETEYLAYADAHPDMEAKVSE